MINAIDVIARLSKIRVGIASKEDVIAPRLSKLSYIYE
jgi:hypothetical protein